MLTLAGAVQRQHHAYTVITEGSISQDGVSMHECGRCAANPSSTCLKNHAIWCQALTFTRYSQLKAMSLYNTSIHAHLQPLGKDAIEL